MNRDRIRGRRLTRTATFILAVSAGMSDAQTTTRIGSSVSCEACSITIASVVTLSGTEFDGPATLIARGRSGEFYLMDPGERLLKVFASDGRFVRTIGRQGGGPGEYERIRNILLPEDGTIHLLDGTLGRRSVFSRDGKFLESSPVRLYGGTGMAGVLLPKGDLIVNIRPTPEDRRIAVLQRIDRAGSATAIFDDASRDLRKTWLQQRLLWARPTGEVLVGRPFSFAIDVYDPDLRKSLSVVRVDDWIPSTDPDEEPGDGAFDKPYSPRLLGIWEDAQGLLWLHMMLPSPKWKPQAPPSRGAHLSRQDLDQLARRPRVETVIEVVDLRRRRVVARSRFEGALGLPFGGGYVAQSIVDSTGNAALQISRFILNR